MTDLNLGKQSEFWPLGIQVAGMFSYFQAPSPLWDDTDTHFLYSNLSPNYKLTFTGQKITTETGMQALPNDLHIT